jgi:hypothetical protein
VRERIANAARCARDEYVHEYSIANKKPAEILAGFNMSKSYLTFFGNSTFLGKTLGFALLTFLQFWLYQRAH